MSTMGVEQNPFLCVRPLNLIFLVWSAPKPSVLTLIVFYRQGIRHAHPHHDTSLLSHSNPPAKLDSCMQGDVRSAHFCMASEYKQSGSILLWLTPKQSKLKLYPEIGQHFFIFFSREQLLPLTCHFNGWFQ